MLRQWGQERPELDTSGMAVVLRILQLSGILNDRLKATLAPSGLEPWEFDVLSALRRAGPRGGVPSKALCESAQLTSGAMSNRIDRLEERGFVRRRPHPEDRRSNTIHLTPKGRERIDRVIGARMDDAAASLEGLPVADQRRLAGLLRDVLLLLDATAEAPADGTRD
jgi:DNA-binding MarR family transcriptional regulator